MPHPITLRQGSLTVDLQPGWGGRITAFRWGKEDLLLPLAGEAMDGQTIPPGGCFPLVPWSNRIRGAELLWQVRTIKLTPSPGEQGHAHHGHGLWNEWSGSLNDHACIMHYTHPVGKAGWQWAYAVTQTATLTASELMLTMRLENRSKEPMPYGLGWHPYFPSNAQTMVQYAARQSWPSAEGQIFPVGPEPMPEALNRQQEGPLPMNLDQGFSDWNGRFRIAWPDRGLALEAEASAELDKLHLYTPPGKGFCCLEPVSHAVDGFNLAEKGMEQAGRRVLEPGGEVTVYLRFRPQASAHIS